MAVLMAALVTSLAAAAVPERVLRVGAEQAGHADGHSAGQRHAQRLHPQQPVQRELG